jgi:hypothetical protein
MRITDAAVGQRGNYRTTMTTGLGTETLHLPLLVLHHKFSKIHETEIFRISHNPSEIFILLDSWVTSIPSVKMLGPQKRNACPYIFVKNIICLNVGLLKIWRVFFVSCETEYGRVTTNCCFMGDIKFKTSYRSPTEAELMHRTRYQQRSELAYYPNESTEIIAGIIQTEVQEYSSAVATYRHSDYSQDNGQRCRFSPTITSTVPLSISYTLFSAHRNEPNKHKYLLILLTDSAPGVTDKRSLRHSQHPKKEFKNLTDSTQAFK